VLLPAMETLRAIKVDAMLDYQRWPASIYVLLLTGVVVLCSRLFSHPPLPANAPKLLKGGWPILGDVEFFSNRAEWCKAAIAASKTGNFTFHFGENQIVNLAGLQGRKTFFESRELNFNEGYARLFTGQPNPEPNEDKSKSKDEDDFSSWFTKCLTRCFRTENMDRRLGQLIVDARARLDSVVARGGDIMDPFHDVYAIVYQLTMRTVGSNEIARSPKLLAETLELFEHIEDNVSVTRVAYSWVPTLRYFKQMYYGGKLYMVFKKIVDDRKKIGHREHDTVQALLDDGASVKKILMFVVGSLFAGQLNSGINAAWMFAWLAANPYWYKQVQVEVDGVVARHRTSKDQTPFEVLQSLTLKAWESEFPLVDVTLRECIRLTLVGVGFRKNTAGRDLPIGSTGEVIPTNAFAIFLTDDVHMDPDIYPDPWNFDPGRYLPDRAEDKKQPFAYMGWGQGRHPCLGMRFAKLEMGIIAAVFMAMFDFELCDEEGNKVARPPPVDRNRHSAHKPETPVRLKYRVRESWK
jgi:sterol 14-demethylase